MHLFVLSSNECKQFQNFNNYYLTVRVNSGMKFKISLKLSLQYVYYFYNMSIKHSQSAMFRSYMK